MSSLLPSNDSNLVIRIAFRSGGVSEERGDEAQVEALFAQDTALLIDYVMAYCPVTHETALWCHEQDERWDDFDEEIAGLE